MLRRRVCELTRKYPKSGRKFCWSSCNYCSVVTTNEPIVISSVHRIFNAPHEKYSIFEQKNRRFSDVSNISRKSDIMEGGGDAKPLTVDYDEVVEAQENGDFIIDVREQNEIDETGKLPGSIHIPMDDVTKLLLTLPNEIFEKKYERAKPDKNTKIILSCRTGMRSGKVQRQLQQLGYKKVYNYTGGWVDWEAREEV